MHLGNVSFLGEHGKTYAMAPAYDMLPAALAPGRSGAIPAGIPPPSLDACIPLAVWHQVRPMADCFLKRLRIDDRCDPEFRVLVDMVLSDRLAAVDSMLARLSS
jgi:hypothetical protein